MRIIVLCKRQYTGKDLLNDRYGRLYEIPRHLALNNHQVVGLCLSYRNRQEGHIQGVAIDKSPVEWHSINLGLSVFPGLFRHRQYLARLIAEFNPQLILACSDVFHVIAGVNMARRLNIPCVADLYDNFESFGATRIPGITHLFRKSVNKATGVLCVSDTLNEYVRETCNPQGAVKTVVNGINTELFHPMDKQSCRQHLGLSVDTRIIGTAGAISRSRGIETLFDGFAQLSKDDPGLHLVLSGPICPDVTLPSGPSIHYLGNLPQTEVPLLLNALDVAIICNIETPFGRHCFPQKTYEILACKVPVVAARVGAMAKLLCHHSECLYSPADISSFTEAVRDQLQTPSKINIPVPTWSELTKEVEELLEGCL